MMFKTTYYRREDGVKPEILPNRLPSLTIPDQSMTVQELLDNYARGLKFEVGKVPVYHGEDNQFGLDIDEWMKLDLVDRQELLDYTRQFVQDERDRRNKLAQKKTPAKTKAPVVKTDTFDDADVIETTTVTKRSVPKKPDNSNPA